MNFHCLCSVPSGTPVNFSVTARTSTSVEASWQLPAANAMNGIITGFKLFFRRSGSVTSFVLTIQNQGGLTRNVTRLEKYTQYEVQVLAYTSVGDGPNTSVIVGRTKEDGKIYYLILSHFNSIIKYSNPG